MVGEQSPWSRGCDFHSVKATSCAITALLLVSRSIPGDTKTDACLPAVGEMSAQEPKVAAHSKMMVHPEIGSAPICHAKAAACTAAILTALTSVCRRASAKRRLPMPTKPLTRSALIHGGAGAPQDVKSQANAALSAVGEMSTQKTEIGADTPVSIELIIRSTAQSPGKGSIRSRYLAGNVGSQFSSETVFPKSCVDEWKEFVPLNFRTPQEVTRAGEYPHHVAVYKRAADLGQCECAQSGMVIKSVIVQKQLKFGGRIPSDARVETIQALIAGCVLITAIELDVLLP